MENIKNHSIKEKKPSYFGIIVITVLISFIVSFIVGLASAGLGEKVVTPFIQEKLLGKDETLLPGEKQIVEEESEVIEAVNKAKPAVVSIIVTQDLEKIYGKQFPFGNSFWEEFFGFKFRLPEAPEGKQEVGGGTGFFISKEGLILTNRHVVSYEDAEYTVITQDGNKYTATVVAKNSLTDVAMIKVDVKNHPFLELGDSDVLKVGQTVIAIGNALGQYQNSVTKGIISATGRAIMAGGAEGGLAQRLENVIQTDAAINPGNSGGPLINLSGEVIGINTAIDVSGQLVGFAIPINSAKSDIESVKKKGKITSAFLGVRYVLINKEIAERNKLEVDYGALIIGDRKKNELAVIPGSPADKAGLEENDIILEVEGNKITEENSLAKIIRKYKPGDEIKLKFLHDGEEKVVKVKLTEAETY